MRVFRYLRFGDWVIIAGIITLSIGFIPFLHSATRGKIAVVHVGDAVVAKLSLQCNQKLVFTGRLGETEIEVKEGQVRVVRSPGPQKICVRRGWISKAGQILICLPNRVTVEIPGEAEYDALVR